MPISNISNNELGSSVRGKLNAVINAVNELTSRYVYRAFIQQNGTSPPTEIALFDDSITAIAGSYSWARAGTGTYLFQTNYGIFQPSNCYYTFHYELDTGGLIDVRFYLSRTSNNVITLRSYSGNNLSDSIVRGFIEVVVLPTS
jgi:hypothetical protein